MAKIAFDTAGFVSIRVYVQQFDKQMSSYLEYKVDSGANRTTISKKKLNDLGYSDDWIKREGTQVVGKECPSTATGEVVKDCYKVIIPEIRIGSWTGINWQFLVRMNNDEKQQFRLLFGTDSMRFFTWYFDYANGVCDYNGIKGARYTLYNQVEQILFSIDGITEDAGSDPNRVVHWLENGSVYHNSGQCPRLRNSDASAVRSGAKVKSGKSKPCATCCT